MTKIKLKSGDTVKVVAGENKGQQGVIKKVLREKNKAVVEGVNMVSKHQKPSASNPQGGIVEMEAPLHISNLTLLDKEGNPTKVGYRTEDGKKVRFAKSNKEVI